MPLLPRPAGTDMLVLESGEKDVGGDRRGLCEVQGVFEVRLASEFVF